MSINDVVDGMGGASGLMQKSYLSDRFRPKADCRAKRRSLRLHDSDRVPQGVKQLFTSNLKPGISSTGRKK